MDTYYYYYYFFCCYYYIDIYIDVLNANIFLVSIENL